MDLTLEMRDLIIRSAKLYRWEHSDDATWPTP
jgi:hypothetical protein